MRRVLVRQAVAVVLVAVLGALAVWWTLRLTWFPYQDRQLEEPAALAVGAEGRLGLVGYTVTDTRVVPGDSEKGRDLEVAEDAALVVVSLDVAPDATEAPDSCTLRLVGTIDGEETRWDTASYSDSTYEAPDRFESYCSGEPGTPYALQAVYVVPASVADGELELEVSALSLSPQALRLGLGDPPGR